MACVADFLLRIGSLRGAALAPVEAKGAVVVFVFSWTRRFVALFEIKARVVFAFLTGVWIGDVPSLSSRDGINESLSNLFFRALDAISPIAA